MAEIKLHATHRAPRGTRSVRRLRGEGKIPGVIYGLGGDPVTLTVDWRELRAALVTEQGMNAVIHVELDGDSVPTLVKDMQRHPVRRNVLHVDFLRVDLSKTVDVEVPIVLEGEAEAVTRDGGVVAQVLNALLITARPADIPASLTIDISTLEIGHSLRVSDITLPDGVTTPVEPEEAVVSGQHGVSEADLIPEGAEEEEGEGVEGEEGESAAGAEDAGEGAGGGGDGSGESSDDGGSGGDEG